MAAGAMVPPQEPGPLSEPQRILDTFVAPTKTFNDLRRNAAWWGPFLISLIVSIIFVSIVDQKIGFSKVVENQLHAQPKASERLERLAPDQREKAMRQQVSITKWISYAFPVLILIWHAIVALVLLATLKFGLGAEVKYKTLFALVMYCSLPGVLKGVLAGISVFAGVSGDSFTFQNPLATNAGYFLDPASSPALYNVLTSLDIFTIWTLVLGAIGITCISKVKSGAAFAVVFGWFAVLVLGGAAAALAFS